MLPTRPSTAVRNSRVVRVKPIPGRFKRLLLAIKKFALDRGEVTEGRRIDDAGCTSLILRLAMGIERYIGCGRVAKNM
jgi:hypothetical protein